MATKRLRQWFDRLTLPQALACLAGLGALYLFRDRLPETADDWKAWLGVVALAGSTAGTLLHGREAPKEEP